MGRRVRVLKLKEVRRSYPRARRSCAGAHDTVLSKYFVLSSWVGGTPKLGGWNPEVGWVEPRSWVGGTPKLGGWNPEVGWVELRSWVGGTPKLGGWNPEVGWVEPERKVGGTPKAGRQTLMAGGRNPESGQADPHGGRAEPRKQTGGSPKERSPEGERPDLHIPYSIPPIQQYAHTPIPLHI